MASVAALQHVSDETAIRTSTRTALVVRVAGDGGRKQSRLHMSRSQEPAESLLFPLKRRSSRALAAEAPADNYVGFDASHGHLCALADPPAQPLAASSRAGPSRRIGIRAQPIGIRAPPHAARPDADGAPERRTRTPSK